MQLLAILVLAFGVIISTGPEDVPTSLCYDPLLGPSMIIYTDCGGIQEKKDKAQPENINLQTEQLTDQKPEHLTVQPIEQVVIEPTEKAINQQTGQSIEQPKSKKQKCNKGSGNGGEGCDPGNNPDKGNNDEGGDQHPQHGKKDKKH